jgi:release factor glutamine methyltransferase
MLTFLNAYYELSQSLCAIYDAQEAASIAHEAMNSICNMNKMERLLHKDTQLSSTQYQLFLQYKTALIAGKPLQYVLGSCIFYGYPFTVNEAVLIPRPETEELVQWIIDDNKQNSKHLNIMDIGCGSACIAISLAKKLPNSIVSAIDISPGALIVAAQNSELNKVEINLLKMDILNDIDREELGLFDIIVSNPPYILNHEIEEMHPNVKDYEPHIALFVTNNDPLQFYKAIGQFGITHLQSDGAIYCETHKEYALSCKAYFKEIGYSTVEARKDLNGHWRMIKAIK